MNEYNKYFSIGNHVGKVISEDEFQVFMANKKIFITKCRMTGLDAAKAMNIDVSEFAIEERTYGGHIVADSLKEAEQVAIERGFGEEIEGWLCGIVPNNDEPGLYDTSKNN